MVRRMGDEDKCEQVRIMHVRQKRVAIGQIYSMLLTMRRFPWWSSIGIWDVWLMNIWS